MICDFNDKISKILNVNVRILEIMSKVNILKGPLPNVKISKSPMANVKNRSIIHLSIISRCVPFAEITSIAILALELRHSTNHKPTPPIRGAFSFWFWIQTSFVTINLIGYMFFKTLQEILGEKIQSLAL